MESYKKVLKNLGILTIGQFSSKILIFLLVPLYTSILTTEEYGIYDFIYTSVNLLMPILTLNISVSSQRFLLQKDADVNSTVKVSVKFMVIGMLLASIMLIFNNMFHISDLLSSYSIYFILLFSVISINSILTEIAVGFERIKCVAVSGVISTFGTVILNVLFLLVVKLGLTGYFFATILGMGIQTIYLIYKLSIFKFLLKKEAKSKQLEKEMLRYSCPQIANSISWWINNASDRYILIFFCGVTANGIYSVAYKIPAILNMLGGILSQATGLSIVKNFDPEDKDGFFSNIYNTYGGFLVVACSFIICFIKIIAKFLFANDFFVAWKYTPILIIASLFGALSGYLGGAFSAKFAAKEFAFSTVIGAVVNVALNFILIPWLGALGAAIATMISYMVIWIIRIKKVGEYIQVKINIKRDMISYFALLLQSLIVCSEILDGLVLYIIEIILLIIQILLYFKEAKKIYVSIFNKIKGERDE